MLHLVSALDLGGSAARFVTKAARCAVLIPHGSKLTFPVVLSYCAPPFGGWARFPFQELLPPVSGDHPLGIVTPFGVVGRYIDAFGSPDRRPY